MTARADRESVAVSRTAVLDTTSGEFTRSEILRGMSCSQGEAGAVSS
jgi:hypothetical protein